MNKLKYTILKTLDSSNEPLNTTELLNTLHQHENDYLTSQKHLDDLIALGAVQYTDVYETALCITVTGREYIDNYVYREKHDSLYIDELESAKATAKFSRIISIISVIIAALSVVTNIITALLLN